MSYREAMLSLQVIAERSMGAPQRAMVLAAKEREDKAAAAVLDALGGRG